MSDGDEFCCPPGEDVSGDLEGLCCVWKVTLEENKCGRGTSFDVSKLTSKQKLCYHCSGFGYDCDGYIPVGDC